MPEPSIWPPPPETLNLLAIHDDFLAACIRSSTPKRPLLRLSLAVNLRDETGLDLRSCLVVVNNFCDRHAILVPVHGLVVWSPILVPLIMITMRSVMIYVLDQRHDAAITYMERVMITAEKRQADLIFIGVYVIVTIIGGVFAFFRQKKMQSQAEEARAKFMR